jgi:phage gpG-like protein
MAASASVDTEAFTAALRAWGERTVEATQAGVKAGAEIVREAVQANLARSTYPPASQPGDPPAWRTGYLHDHVYVRTLAIDAGWQARIYPSTAYARIHELSGWAGRDHRSFLPARPYVRPASQSSAQDAAAAIAAAWRKALPGG